MAFEYPPDPLLRGLAALRQVTNGPEPPLPEHGAFLVDLALREQQLNTPEVRHQVLDAPLLECHVANDWRRDRGESSRANSVSAGRVRPPIKATQKARQLLWTDARLEGADRAKDAHHLQPGSSCSLGKHSRRARGPNLPPGPGRPQLQATLFLPRTPAATTTSFPYWMLLFRQASLGGAPMSHIIGIRLTRHGRGGCIPMRDIM